VRVWCRGAEEVAVEYRRGAGDAEEDQGVGVRQEPGGDWGGEGLKWLGVVVCYEGLGLLACG
jgi:hypothetical protein